MRTVVCRTEWPTGRALTIGLPCSHSSALRGGSARWSDTSEAFPKDAHRLLQAGATLAVWPAPGLQINFFPGAEVAFDFDRREVVTEADARALGTFIRQLGRWLHSRITVSHEGSTAAFLRYDPAVDRFDWLT
jgi:hypothetical protein